MTKVRTICAQCGVGCGLVAWRAGEQQLEIEGDSRHPANRGALCLRGWHLADMLEPEARLARPRVGGRAAGWSKALSTVAARLTDTVARDGPESVAFLLSDGLLTEDAYVANKLMKGFIGAANIGTASPAHGADAAALVRAFGEDVGTAGLEDVDRAELVVMLGQDVPARHPLAMDRAKAANRGQGARLAVIGADAASYESDADICLPIRTGSAAALMRGLLAWCRRAGAVDEGWLAARVKVPEGFWDALAEGADLWSVARACDVPACDVQRFFDMVVASPRMVTLFDHDTQDKDAARDLASAIVNVHLATGRVGKPGAGFLSVAGGANGMGLREVGAFSTMLAAHRGFDAESRADAGRLWGAPSVAAGPGLEGDALWEAVLDGRIKALWIMEGDPAGDEIDTGPARAALAACPLVILSDCYADSETAGFAHIMLPTNDAAERNGTATGFDRLISRQRPVSPASGEARPGWWIVTQVAQHMGWHDAFYFRAAADVYREHARLSAYGNGGERQFDLRRHAAISNPAYDEMTPWRWGGAPFAEGRFATEDGRARLVSVD